MHHSGRMLHSPAWRLLPLILGVSLALAAGCGGGWKQKAEAAAARADSLVEDGHLDEARAAYEEALSHNPFHKQANLNLALLIERSFLNEALALYYYRRYLDLPGEVNLTRKLVEKQSEMLQEMILGQVEDPVDATEDFLWAVGSDCNRVFAERLQTDFIERLVEHGWGPTGYFEAWRDERLAGHTPRIVYREMIRSRGVGRAEVWVDLVDTNDPSRIVRRKLTWRLQGTLWELSGDEVRRPEA